MHWEAWGAGLAVLQGLAVIFLMVMSIGTWKARREDSTTNLGAQLKAQQAAITEIQNLVVRKVDLARCDERFGLVGQQVDQMVTLDHCQTVHRQIEADYQRTSKTAHDAAQAAQTVVTATAVITKQLEGLAAQMTDSTKRLGRIETALMKAAGDGND